VLRFPEKKWESKQATAMNASAQTGWKIVQILAKCYGL
jgi:hypothetical protein